MPLLRTQGDIVYVRLGWNKAIRCCKGRVQGAGEDDTLTVSIHCHDGSKVVVIAIFEGVETVRADGWPPVLIVAVVGPFCGEALQMVAQTVVGWGRVCRWDQLDSSDGCHVSLNVDVGIFTMQVVAEIGDEPLQISNP